MDGLCSWPIRGSRRQARMPGADATRRACARRGGLSHVMGDPRQARAATWTWSARRRPPARLSPPSPSPGRGQPSRASPARHRTKGAVGRRTQLEKEVYVTADVGGRV